MYRTIRIIQTGATPELTMKEWSKCTEAAWRAAGKFWHEELREKHFTKAGAQEYGYAPRKGEGLSGKAFWRSYTGRKLRMFGHTKPLVWSGRGEAGTRRQDIKPGRDGNQPYSWVVITLHSPVFNFRNPKSNVDMRKELRTVSDRETIQIGLVYQRALVAAINSLGGSQTTRVA